LHFVRRIPTLRFASRIEVPIVSILKTHSKEKVKDYLYFIEYLTSGGSVNECRKGWPCLVGSQRAQPNSAIFPTSALSFYQLPFNRRTLVTPAAIKSQWPHSNF